MWFFFFKQRTAYEMRISDGSSDVCSSDLVQRIIVAFGQHGPHPVLSCNLTRRCGASMRDDGGRSCFARAGFLPHDYYVESCRLYQKAAGQKFLSCLDNIFLPSGSCISSICPSAVKPVCVMLCMLFPLLLYYLIFTLLYSLHSFSS